MIAVANENGDQANKEQVTNAETFMLQSILKSCTKQDKRDIYDRKCEERGDVPIFWSKVMRLQRIHKNPDQILNNIEFSENAKVNNEKSV